MHARHRLLDLHDRKASYPRAILRYAGLMATHDIAAEPRRATVAAAAGTVQVLSTLWSDDADRAERALRSAGITVTRFSADYLFSGGLPGVVSLPGRSLSLHVPAADARRAAALLRASRRSFWEELRVLLRPLGRT